MEASREEAILLLKKWQSDSSEIRCSVIRESDFRISLFLRITSLKESSLALSGPNDNRVLLDLSKAEFEFLDSTGIPDPQFAYVAERFVEAILAIIFINIKVNFILTVRK